MDSGLIRFRRPNRRPEPEASELVNERCLRTGKVRHFGFRSAQIAQERMTKPDAGEPSIYQCPHCGCWHVGHRAW